MTIDTYPQARCDEIWEPRKRLLRYRWVGTKTVDAYILFTTHCPAVASIDRHYRRFLLDYFSLPKYMKPPEKGSLYTLELRRMPFKK